MKIMQISSYALDKVFSMLFSDRVTTPKWDRESEKVKPTLNMIQLYFLHNYVICAMLIY